MQAKRGVFIINKINIRNGLFKSMRFMIFVCFFVLITAFIILYSVIVQKTLENRSLEQKRNYTVNRCTILLNQLVNSGFFNGNGTLNMENQIDQLATLLDGRIMVVNSSYRILADTYQLNQNNYLVSENAVKAMTGVMEQEENNRIHDGYIECYITVGNSSSTLKETEGQTSPNAILPDKKSNVETTGMMVVFASVKDSYAILDEVSEQTNMLFVLFIFCVVIVAVVITVILTGHFREFTNSIDAVAQGRTDEAVVVHGFTEMRNLAESFNGAVARLDKLEESRQEFVSNVSHELKTPITSIKVLADSLISQDDIPSEIYREFMEDIVEEIDRENKIINDLLSLVKMDRKSDMVLNVTTVNINELVELLLKRLRPLAAKRNIEIVYESFRAVTAEIDEVKLTLALSNLVENAIKYNVDDGWIRITLNADHKYFYVKIADSGVGIPEDCQERVFERFYRVDKARSRETGGTGLGLAITHSAVSMHHGTIKLHSEHGKGTTFTVRIPLTYSVSMAASNKHAAKEEKKKLQKKSKNKETRVVTPQTVAVPNVSEVQGNLGEVLTAVDENLKKNDENVSGGTEEAQEHVKPSVVTEPAPLADAEPEMVVMHTEEMDTPEVVVLSEEEMKTSDKSDKETFVKEGDLPSDAMAKQQIKMDMDHSEISVPEHDGMEQADVQGTAATEGDTTEHTSFKEEEGGEQG